MHILYFDTSNTRNGHTENMITFSAKVRTVSYKTNLSIRGCLCGDAISLGENLLEQLDVLFRSLVQFTD